MKQKGIWLRNGWRLHHLNAAELALALLVREKPLTAQQLSAALTEKGTRLDRKQLGMTPFEHSWEKFWQSWNVQAQLKRRQGNTSARMKRFSTIRRRTVKVSCWILSA